MEPGRAVRLWLFVTSNGLSCFLANYKKKKKKVSESKIEALRGGAFSTTETLAAG